MQGILLTALDGHRFWFDPGAPCLELCFTGGEGEYAVYETLHQPGDLARWVSTSSVFASARVAATDVRVTPADLVAVKALRQAVWMVANRIADGTAPRPSDLAVLNRVAAEPPPVPQIGGRPSRAAWLTPVDGSQLASAFARDAIELFGSSRRERIRRCEGHRCALVFVDMSRPGARRWCVMERCGNRSKQHTHRARVREKG